MPTCCARRSTARPAIEILAAHAAPNERPSAYSGSLPAARPAEPPEPQSDRDINVAVAHYRERLHFSALHVADAFAVLQRDDARLHLWCADDMTWSEREDLRSKPVRTGAESFLAGTASCRVEVDDIDRLYTELAPTGVLHPVSRVSVTDTEFGTREFATLDVDGNLIEFFRWAR